MMNFWNTQDDTLYSYFFHGFIKFYQVLNIVFKFIKTYSIQLDLYSFSINTTKLIYILSLDTICIIVIFKFFYTRMKLFEPY